MAREFGNRPGNVCTPSWLGQQAKKLGKQFDLDVDVLDRKEIEKLGMGSFLAVAQGSDEPPRFIVARYDGAAKSKAPVVLVGKGITFDTGGLNIKLGDAMTTMKTDMSGGAAVLAALRLIATLRVPVRVTALVPCAENAVGAASYRPGDIVRHVGGRTSEITNTDAEGRIVLADAMAYATAALRPTVLIDVATLTGAMKVSLGLRTGGLFASSDELADALLAAGDATGEPLWRLPLTRDYEKKLSSSVADANNSPGSPGGITAALFLKHFVGHVPWAHLDIAGPARAPKDDGIRTQGATGFGTRLLAHWVSSL
jgi:leucyl aminopeptidase